MKPTYFSKFRLPTILLFAVLLSAPGCQPRNFLKPNFSKMAFWNGDKMNLATKKLPPPSSQFAPEPTGTVSETVDSEAQEIPQQVNALARDADPSLNKGLIRKPYSLESINPNIAREQSNGFEGSPTPLMTPSNTDQLNLGTHFLENLKNTMQQTQQATPFQGSPDKTTGKTTGNQNSIDGWNRDFTPTAQAPTPQTPTGSVQSFQPMPPSPVGQLNSTSAATQPLPAGDRNGFGLPPLTAATPSLSAPTNNNLLQPAPRTNPQSPLNPIPAPINNAGNQFGGSADFTPPKSLQNDLLPKSNSEDFAPIPSTPSSPLDAPTTAYPKTAYPTIKPLIPNDSNQPSSNSGNASENLALAPATPTTSTPSQVPASLRTGSGGFAPGSTKQMKPVEKNWQAPGNSN